MAEIANNNIPKGLFACDLCYRRKVKCDRQDPCKNCIAAKVACLWTRKARERRQKTKTADALKGLFNRINHLEGLLQQPRSSPSLPLEPQLQANNARITTAEHERYDGSGMESELEESVDSRPLSSSCALQQDTQSLPSVGVPETRNSPITSQLELIRKTFAVDRAQNIELDFVLNDSILVCELTTTDIINTMKMPRVRPTDVAFTNLVLPRSSIEKMCLELLNNTITDPQIRLQYHIIVNFQVALSLGQQQPQNEGNDVLNSHIRKLQRQRFRASLASLNKMGFLTPPSLSLLQAQCVGVMILQYFGDVQGAWDVLVAVSRTFVALGYNNITRAPQDQEIADCMRWFFYCDREMGLFLGKPLLLPYMSPPQDMLAIRQGHLSHDLCTAWERITNLYPKIQELASEKMEKKTDNHLDRMTRDCSQDLNEIYQNLQKINRFTDPIEKNLLQCTAILFCKHYAAHTMLWQFRPDLMTSKATRSQLGMYAGLALESLSKLAKYFGVHRCDLEMIPWDVVICGLVPMWVIFCSVIQCGDERGFKLLNEYASLLAELKPYNQLASRIYKICTELIHLCKTILPSQLPPSLPQPDDISDQNVTTSNQPSSRPTPLPTNHDARRVNFLNFDPFFIQNDNVPVSETQAADGDDVKEDDTSRRETEDHYARIFEDGLAKIIVLRPGIYTDTNRLAVSPGFS
ncbi:hypothetical protein BGW36DRAFT_390865 [Talaromyces proteolyticus]|uniref:Zn(2)-C6 fungal-type domain-containing protein n=1 Tax=Talaromyces proteolyticus TaxID=1131652 RepID=A0AAD4PTX1_9EURO|nr:uncharacterized protein BGW36DRAFT_390865 [Talaromyces proteolyticus]KAH8689431.1 hypothetical protein BGW36DRAFT_390865 [Talaromyces proteolyticus]